MPKNLPVALPKAAPPPPPRKKGGNSGSLRGPMNLRVLREPESYEEAAHTLAASLGWEGEWNLQLNGVQVKDAQNFLVKTLHELHIAVLNGKELTPALAVAEHLGLKSYADPEHAKLFLQLVTEGLAEVEKLEREALAEAEKTG